MRERNGPGSRPTYVDDRRHTLSARLGENGSNEDLLTQRALNPGIRTNHNFRTNGSGESQWTDFPINRRPSRHQLLERTPAKIADQLLQLIIAQIGDQCFQMITVQITDHHFQLITAHITDLRSQLIAQNTGSFSDRPHCAQNVATRNPMRKTKKIRKWEALACVGEKATNPEGSGRQCSFEIAHQRFQLIVAPARRRTFSTRWPARHIAGHCFIRFPSTSAAKLLPSIPAQVLAQSQGRLPG